MEVTRFAVKYNPPTLVVEYRATSGSMFLKKIRIKMKDKMVLIFFCISTINAPMSHALYLVLVELGISVR